jgi:hypothetical protein
MIEEDLSAKNIIDITDEETKEIIKEALLSKERHLSGLGNGVQLQNGNHHHSNGFREDKQLADEEDDYVMNISNTA